MSKAKLTAKADASPRPRVAKAPKPAGGARTQRKHRIQAELIAAGTAMFRKHGYDETTVADIANEVGISRRTFFRYFKAKDDLVFKWLDEQGAFVMPMLAAQGEDVPPLRAMQQTFIALAAHHDAEPERVQTLTKLIFETPSLEGRYHGEHARWEDEFVNILRHGRELSEAETFALQIQVAASITTFVVAIRSWAANKNPPPLRQVLEAAFEALAIGAQTL